MLNSTIYDTLVKVNAKVEIYEGSTSDLIKTCTCNNELETFSVTREGDSTKFFGFGICKKLTFTLIDLKNEISIKKGDTVKLYFGSIADDAWDKPFPTFYVEEVSKDEKNNTINVTAYDKLYQASSHTVAELPAITEECTLLNIAYEACVAALFLPSSFPVPTDSNFRTLKYTAENPPNYNGDEDLRTILDQIAEASQTFYYINSQEIVTFKMPHSFSTPIKTITRDDYFELTIKEAVALKSICHVTELGDNLEAITDRVESGATQYIRENPFLNMKDSTEIAAALDYAIQILGGLTLTQFECDWTGDYRLEVCDTLGLTASDGTVHLAYNFGNDNISYAGTLNQLTGWEFNQSNNETASNSTGLGQIINQTFAKVDKVEKTITMFIGETDSKLNEVSGKVSQLELTTNGITQTVSNTQSQVDDLGNTVGTLRNEVNTKVTAEQVEFIVSSELSQGIDKVTTTSKKYTFDDEGLNVSSSDSNISTTISENGMNIYRQGEEVLVANNDGVKAEDLHATTYLIIGNNSRLEDYTNSSGEARTACFWIGG